MIVGHVVSSFDPANDVRRCVRELNLYSSHKHVLYVQDAHPKQAVYQYEEGPRDPAVLAAADVLIHHFANTPQGWHDDSKPSAFRNIHITWDHDTDRFWTNSDYDCGDYSRYKLVSASHVGAVEYMPEERFCWLPDLIPLDGAYSFDPEPRYPAVSYIKHAEQLRRVFFGNGIQHLDCSETAHAEVLSRRRSRASVVIDNLCDGHYGLAGQEAAVLGLPVVVFNHPRTLVAMAGWDKDGAAFPFFQATELGDAIETATTLATDHLWALEHRYAIRDWAEEFLDPRRLIAEYWDPFIEELA